MFDAVQGREQVLMSPNSRDEKNMLCDVIVCMCKC